MGGLPGRAPGRYNPGGPVGGALFDRPPTIHHPTDHKQPQLCPNALLPEYIISLLARPPRLFFMWEQNGLLPKHLLMV